MSEKYAIRQDSGESNVILFFDQALISQEKDKSNDSKTKSLKTKHRNKIKTEWTQLENDKKIIRKIESLAETLHQVKPKQGLATPDFLSLALGDQKAWNVSGTLLNGTIYNENGTLILNPDPYVDILRSDVLPDKKSADRVYLGVVKSDPQFALLSRNENKPPSRRKSEERPHAAN